MSSDKAFVIKLPEVSSSVFKKINKDPDKNLVLSKTICYPSVELGYHSFLHRTKNAMEITNKLDTKTKFYYVVNPYEHKISDYENDLSSYTKKYFKMTKEDPNIMSRAFYKMWEMIYYFDLASKKDLTYAALAEGPGSFLQAVLKFREKYDYNLKNDKYFGVTIHAEDGKNIEMGKLAQRKSLVLLKNTGILPLDPNSKIYIHGFDDNLSKKINKVSLEEAEVIVAKVKTPSWGEKNGESIMEKFFSGGRLDFQKKELDNLLPIFESKPTILVANLRRPSVLTEFEKVSKALIADFDVSNDVIFELIFGEFNPTGKLPIQLPSSMKSVENQIEDLPFDLDKPLFNYGHGLSF